jgi:glycosyltransferase involved in cell wall biosynthesis
MRRGHEVSVFTTEKDIGLPDLSIRERSYRDLPVTELINNLYYRSFRETWDHAPIATAFGAFLDRVQPDVVHVQHLMYLSIGCIEEADRRGIGVLFTLHDYWLHCPRFGQRVHADTSICASIDFARCGDCLSSFKFAQSGLQRNTGKAIASLRDTTGINLAGAAKGAARLLKAGEAVAGSRERPSAEAEAAADMEREVAARDAAFRARVVPRVHKFLSPSRFLRERFIEWGIAGDKIQFLRTGVDPEHFGDGPRTESDRLRVAFIGTFAPHKGAHVLLEAWGKLDPDLRRRGQLELIGSMQHNPEYVAELEHAAQAFDASIRGRIPRGEISAVLRSIDLLVVPSVWYENSPLVIIEAICVRTPLLVSDIGGMAELVREGKSGYHFKVASSDDLARQLGRALSDPSMLASLYREPEPIKRVEEDAHQIEELYLEAIDAARARLRQGRPGEE